MGRHVDKIRVQRKGSIPWISLLLFLPKSDETTEFSCSVVSAQALQAILKFVFGESKMPYPNACNTLLTPTVTKA